MLPKVKRVNFYSASQSNVIIFIVINVRVMAMVMVIGHVVVF